MLELLATGCAGLFAGAAIYINLVEHPARVECGNALARLRTACNDAHRARSSSASWEVGASVGSRRRAFTG